MFGFMKRKPPEPVPLPAPMERCGICEARVSEALMARHFRGHVRLLHHEDHASEDPSLPYRDAQRPRMAVYLVNGGGYYAWSPQAQEGIARAVGYLHAQHPPHAEFQVVPQAYANQSVSHLLVFVRY